MQDHSETLTVDQKSALVVAEFVEFATTIKDFFMSIWGVDGEWLADVSDHDGFVDRVLVWSRKRPVLIYHGKDCALKPLAKMCLAGSDAKTIYFEMFVYPQEEKSAA